MKKTIKFIYGICIDDEGIVTYKLWINLWPERTFDRNYLHVYTWEAFRRLSDASIDPNEQRPEKLFVDTKEAAVQLIWKQAKRELPFLDTTLLTPYFHSRTEGLSSPMWVSWDKIEMDVPMEHPDIPYSWRNRE